MREKHWDSLSYEPGPGYNNDREQPTSDHQAGHGSAAETAVDQSPVDFGQNHQETVSLEEKGPNKVVSFVRRQECMMSVEA